MMDDMIQAFYKTVKEIIRWRPFDSSVNHEWYYAENRLYIIRRKATGEIRFIKAGSPNEALEKYLQERYQGVFEEVRQGEG